MEPKDELVKNEIDSMLDSFEGIVKLEPEPEPEPAPKDPEPTPEPEPEPKEEPAPDPEPEPEPPVQDEKDKIIEDLRSKLAEKESAPPPKEEPKEEPIKLEDHDFLGDTDPEDIIRDKDTFNKLLNSVYMKGVADSKKMATESVLLSIPDIVKTNIEIVSTLKETSDKFYAENEDLVPFKRVVATVFEDIASQNPGKKYTELMSLVGDETRKRLNLQKQAVQKKGNPPNLPQKGGHVPKPTNSKPDLSPMEAEIAAMNQILS